MIGVWSPPRLDYVGGETIKQHDLLYTGLKQLKDCGFVDLVKKRIMTLENNNPGRRKKEPFGPNVGVYVSSVFPLGERGNVAPLQARLQASAPQGTPQPVPPGLSRRPEGVGVGGDGRPEHLAEGCVL